MDKKDTDEFSAIVEKFINSDGSAGAAAEMLGGVAEKEQLEGAISEMFATIDAAIDLERDIEERGEEQAFGNSERASTDAGKEEVSKATVEALDALTEEV